MHILKDSITLTAYFEKPMKKKIAYLVLTIMLTNLPLCKSQEVKEEVPDDVLEEELRAEAEPIREIRDRDLKEEVKKPLKKR